jgi:hypothetical protein
MFLGMWMTVMEVLEGEEFVKKRFEGEDGWRR